MVKFWVGVVSENHVKRGVTGGFCQVCHGKGGPLKRMKKGDYLLYYSPKIDLDSDQKLQAFTAVGKMTGDEVYQFEMAPDFIPFRRDVEYYKSVRPCPIGTARQHPDWKNYAS
ncbi:EVE domain protein [Streptococcus constellatus subsp. constellatus SK53]|uniref:EVE domain protein n=2 Tax=Streptococcus TaxID=1301 RepID=A0AAD2SVC8_STRCV|nr:EVE domain protein [Streptococcus constellatus subsp. constellatus SK53]BBD22030.1 hypothetical protein SCSC_0349 [Streptococcus constellatus subsp. constellatus]GAD39412.1 hypothetical protein ANG2_1739 [Streptococcus constellatus subsp. constellatus SK53]SUN39972.1 EVE domain [Streptococcus constellatus]